MAFPAGLKVLGGALTGVAEGIQAIPEYLDKDEELAQRHALRPLTLEEAKLRLEESRRKSMQPKVQSLGQGNYAITNPDGTIEVRSLGGAAGGALKDTTYMRNLRGLLDMAADSSNPQQAKLAQGILEQRAGIRTPAQAQMFQRYFGAIDRGEEPDAADAEYVRQTQNRYMRQPEAGAGYSPVYPPMPGGATGQAPQAPPQPAPGSTTPGQPPTQRVAPRLPSVPLGDGAVESRLARAILGNEGSGDQSISPKGAVSKWQLMPETARKYLPPGMQQLSAPQIQEALRKYPGLADNVGMAHLKALQDTYPGRPDLVAAAYFSGEDNVDEVTGTIKNPQLRAVGNDGKPFGPTVQHYVDSFMQRYSGQAPGPQPSAQPTQRPGVPAAGIQPPIATSAPHVTPPAVPLAPPAQPGSGPTRGYVARTQAAEDKAKALPTFKPEQVAKAQELFPWLGARPDLRTLSNEQINLVNKAVEAGKEDTAYHRVLRQAAPQIAELASMESSKQMAKRAEELIVPETVGMRGKSNRMIQQLVQQLPLDEQTKAGYFDPRIPDLEVVSHAIGYIHANAIKRIGAAGGPGQRGVIKYDVEEVSKWFDPFAATASVPEMKEKLAELQRLIQQAKPIVEHEMRALGLDPKTLEPLKGRKFGGEEAPQAPAALDPNDAFDKALQD